MSRGKAAKTIRPIPVLATLILLVAGAVLSSLFFQKPAQPQPTDMADFTPLADPRVLSQLISGQDPLPPEYEPYADFLGQRLVPPKLALSNDIVNVLGTGSDEKRIEVDLTHQRVYAFEGDHRVNEFIVSTGKWFPTPTGEFRIWSKVRSQKMSGGSRERGTYYYLPGVPYISFFYNDEIPKHKGYSFHGTYWHSNFGHPMSHGCVNMKIEDAKWLYEWANPVVTNPKKWSVLAASDNPGTRIIIYGTTPKE